jgi:sodium-dependent dicarboxylate transporter 2/3/5
VELEGAEHKPHTPWLQWAGRLGAPTVGLAAWAALPQGPGALSAEGRATAGVALAMAALWMTEALPLPVTALLPILLLPLFGVASVTEAAAPYANEVIYLFLGGFFLALAMERWGLHRRLAYGVLASVGPRPGAALAGMMGATGFLSMWVSNSAATMVMLPLATSLVGLTDAHPDARDRTNFAVSMLLGVAWAASIGSLGTVIGTPPNLFLRGFAARTLQVDVGFGAWMVVGVPVAAALLALAWWVLRRLHPVGLPELPGGREAIAAARAALGPMSRGEKLMLGVFGLALLGWLAREPLSRVDAAATALPFLARLSDTSVAVGAAVLLFVVPVDARRGVFLLDWDTARRAPWDVLLLFGGGLSLAAAIQKTGLAQWLGEQLAHVGTLPMPVMVALVTTLLIFLTELTSNTATAATFLPLLASVAASTGVAPMLLLLPATLAATCAFMLPVATPPNAIVFAGGRLTVRQMARAGLWLNLLGIVVITVATLTLGRWLFS